MGNAREIRAMGYEYDSSIGSGRHIVPETDQHDDIHVLKWSRDVDVPVHAACSTVPPTSPSTPDDPDNQEV